MNFDGQPRQQQQQPVPAALVPAANMAVEAPALPELFDVEAGIAGDMPRRSNQGFPILDLPPLPDF